MFRRLVDKARVSFADRRLPPPTRKELCAAEKLINTFRNTPIFDTTDVSPSEELWLKNMNRLRESVLKRNVREFLRWDVVVDTMFLKRADYITTELSHIKKLPNYQSRWNFAIKEAQVGRPTPCIELLESSANLIHHAYHVAKFEEITASSVTNSKFVLEFGGGYGSMCRLFHNLGFTGKYVIYDLPSFSALQKYYLESLGIQILNIDSFRNADGGVLCLSDVNELLSVCGDPSTKNDSIFVATWSLSESPVSVRRAFLPALENIKSFLIAYQDNFGEVNNIDFFHDWTRNRTDIMWHEWKISHIPGSSYLMGQKYSQNNLN